MFYILDLGIMKSDTYENRAFSSYSYPFFKSMI
jgi:hypothetical protein